MRRIALIAATALTTLACALLPSGALAHGRHGHHHARRARHHGRVLHAGFFGANRGSGSQQTGSPGNTGSGDNAGPGSSGTENVGPTPGTPEGNAGKIVSFTEGVLTIELGEGEKATKISGKVTEETEIHCIPAPAATPPTPPANTSEDDGGPGQQSDGGEPGASQEDDMGAGDDQSGDRDEQGGEQAPCTTADLTPGTVVHRAELQLTESGAVFREIELVH